MKKIAWILAILMLFTACGKKEPGLDDLPSDGGIDINAPADEGTSDGLEAADTPVVTFTPVTGTVGVPEPIHFPAAMLFSQTQNLYECDPREGYYVSVGALVSGMQPNAAYIWLKGKNDSTLITLPTDGICKGMMGSNGVYYTFDNQGAAYAWYLYQEEREWKTEGCKITPPAGYYVSLAGDGSTSGPDWFVVLSAEGKSDRILATFDYAETYVELNVSELEEAHGTMTVCSIDHGNSTEYVIYVKFADGTQKALVGSLAMGADFMVTDTDAELVPAPMFTDATTVLPILG